MTPPDEHTSEGGRDDRGVPCHAEPTLSSAQVLKTKHNSRPSIYFRRLPEADDAGRTLISHFRPTERQQQINEESMGGYDNSHQNE